MDVISIYFPFNNRSCCNYRSPFYCAGPNYSRTKPYKRIAFNYYFWAWKPALCINCFVWIIKFVIIAHKRHIT